MPKPTVAIFVYCLRGGGAERVCVNLANALLAKGYRVTLVTELAPSTDQYALSPGAGRVVIGETGKGGAMAKAWRLVRKTARLRDFLKREEPDVLISFMTRCNAMALAASIGLPCRIIISERNDPRYRPEPLLDRTLRALLYRHSDMLVAQTPVLEEVSRTHFHVASTACIPNPFLPAIAAKAETPLSAESIRPYALAMGRLNRQKGFDVLIRAFAQSAERHALDLVIAGQGEEREPLHALAQDMGVADRVKFAGHVEQPFSLLEGCKMFILSSRYEGFPNVLLEAMSFGRPVISTRLPSGAHAIIEDGVSGLLVSPGDVGSLAQAIGRIAADGALAERLGANGRKAIEPFGLEPVIAQWREVIEKVAA